MNKGLVSQMFQSLGQRGVGSVSKVFRVGASELDSFRFLASELAARLSRQTDTRDEESILGHPLCHRSSFGNGEPAAAARMQGIWPRGTPSFCERSLPARCTMIVGLRSEVRESLLTASHCREAGRPIFSYCRRMPSKLVFPTARLT